MKKNINLPFTNELKGGSKKSFKILNETQLNNKLKKDTTILNVLKKFIDFSNTNNISKTSNKLNYIKASETKKYYKNLKT